MTKFVQIHTLTTYGPNNLNRDDMGRPKTSALGAVTRQRISSQCNKHWWRASDLFRKGVSEAVGIRTRKLGAEVEKHLIANDVPATKAKAVASEIMRLWEKKKKDDGKKKDDSNGDEPDASETTFLFCGTEWNRAKEVALERARGELKDKKGEKERAIALSDFLGNRHVSVDVALWGRMLAAAPDYSVDAACSVAHTITTHEVTIEDDYFAVRDEKGAEDEGEGAAHIGRRYFSGGGVYYSYVCLDVDLLRVNLRDNAELTPAVVESLIRTVTQVSPGGMQTTMATPSVASYALVEIGDQQPRTLQAAFVQPIKGHEVLSGSVQRLEQVRSQIDRVYGPQAAAVAAIDTTGTSKIDGAKAATLDDIIKLALGEFAACAA